MRPASQHFFIHSCIYLRILIISYLATFLGTDSLSVLMIRTAVNQSITLPRHYHTAMALSYCHGGTITLLWRYHTATVLSHYRGTIILPWCYHTVTALSHCRGAITLSHFHTACFFIEELNETKSNSIF